MKCEKCGFEIKKLSNNCDNCGAPLLNSTETVDEIKSYKKGKHIDIEDIVAEKKPKSFNQTKRNVRNFLIFLFLIIIIAVVYLIGVLLTDLFSQEMFDKYEDIMEHSTLALVYLGNDESIDEACVEYSTNYGFDYLNIDVKNISYAKKKMLRRELNVYNLTSTLVVVQEGVPISHYSKLENVEQLTNYLQTDNLIPMVIEDTEDTLNTYQSAMKAKEDTIIYLPTTYESDTDDKGKAIMKISEENDLIYTEVKGYILSNRQLIKIMSDLGFSTIQSDLIVYVSEGKVVSVLEASEKSESEYFHLFSNRGIIDVTSGDNLEEISRTEFSNILDKNDRSVIFISENNCSYCERVKPILGKIASQNNLKIYSLDATKNKDKISDMIKDIGYKDGLTNTPFVLIVDNGKYIDSIVGLADMDLYTNKFTEYGVIK